MSNTSLSLEIESLLFQSKLRWLKTSEIFTILLNISSTNLCSMALNKLPYQPKNGDVFIINGDTQCKKWKNDGYLYLPRKTGVGFREDIEKLKVGGVKEIVCYYSYVIQPSQMNQNANNSDVVLNRRIYKLMNGLKEENNFYLVHYLKEPTNNVNQFAKLSVRSELTEDKNTQETRSIPMYSPFNFGESPIEDKNYQECVNRQEEMMILERDFIGIGNPADAQNYDFCQEMINFDENSEMPFLEHPKPLQETFDVNNNINNKPPVNLQQEQDSGNYQALQNRIMELEARIHDLEFEKQSGQNNTNSTVSNSIFSMVQNNSNGTNATNNDYKIKINDFSPEWDFVEGGSKMMICFSPNLMIPSEDQSNKLMVMFGNVEARAFCIQPGVLKCYVPPHNKGFVKLSIVLNRDRIDDCMDKSSMFEYRKAHASKRKIPKIDELMLEKEDTKKISHDFKVRIIEKLSNFHQNLAVNSYSGQNPQEKKWNLEEIPALLEDFLKNSESFDVCAFNSILSTILKKADETDIPRETITQQLNEVNEDGFALIHYLILINFSDTIPLLAKYNVDLNLSSKGGITPLQIAIAFNYEYAVEMLIKHGVINSNNIESLINSNSNKSLLNQNIANLDILFKNSHILDMIMREVTLQDSINNSNSVHTEKFSCNNQDDQEDDNYFNILELLNEMEDKFVIHSDEETKNRNKENHMFKGEKNNSQFEMKKHKYLKFHSKKNKKENKKKDLQGQALGNELKNKEVYVTHQEHIKTIQKNVRGWLLRRQYLDIKYAARVLQNYIRGKLAKKQMSPEYKMLIKNKLKDWLNLKC